MSQDNRLKRSEIAGALGPSVQGAVLEESAKPDPVSINQPSTQDGAQDAQEEAPDLEALAAVTTDPVYSVFCTWKKRYIVIMVTWAAFISPTSANIYFPALNPIREELGVSATLINLTLTSYMVFQGLAPTIFGDLAD